MAPTDGRVAKPERRWGCRCRTPKEVNQEDSEEIEVDGMKKGADSAGKVKSGW